ncbi:hypothetical protein CL8NIID27_12820 [Escherichia coli]|nr:hypothetical protein CL8NIID27_12820 [Escherichia coli]
MGRGGGGTTKNFLNEGVKINAHTSKSLNKHASRKHESGATNDQNAQRQNTAKI